MWSTGLWAVMFRTAALVAVLALAVAPAAAFYPAPKFTLDLDKEPSKRWAGAVSKVIDAFGYEHSFGPVITLYTGLMELLPESFLAAAEKKIEARFPEYAAEVRGIDAELKAHGHPLPRPTGWYFVYELGHISLESVPNAPAWFRRFKAEYAKSCTAILALPANRSAAVIHGRNMDESPRAGRNMTLDIEVVSNGRRVARVFDWVWVTGGFYTGQVDDPVRGLTMEMNWRNNGTASLEHILNSLLQPETMPVIFAYRTIVEAGLPFEAAVQFLNNATFAVPFYAILSGTGRRGAVLSLSANKEYNVIERLSDQAPHPWYMVQTNYDRWKPDPTSDPRRTVAEQHMDMLGAARGATDLGVWMTLSTYPVHNPNTMYSVLMGVDRSTIEGFIRIPMRPT